MTQPAAPIEIAESDRPVLERLAAEGPALVERAVGWSHIGSGSSNLPGLLNMAGALEAYMRTLPGRFERIELPAIETIGADGRAGARPTGPALKLSIRPEAPVRVIFTGHYDTVFAEDSPFTKVTERPDGALNGPGLADMKGGIAVMLAGLAAFETHPLAGRLGHTVLLSPDEEIGSPASAPLLAQIAREGRVGFTYEPAADDGGLIAGRRGSANYDLIVRGRSAHAGRNPEEGRNAVTAAARAALAAEALAAERADLTVNISRIDGGGPGNVVPDLAVARINLRAETEETARWADARLRAITAKAEAGGISAELKGGFHRPPKPFTPAQQTLFAAVRETGALIGQDLIWRNSGGVCEGNNLFAAGLPGIDTLGVRGGDIHSVNEYAWPESFAERAQLTALLLCQVARGAIDVRAIKSAMRLLA